MSKRSTNLHINNTNTTCFLMYVVKKQKTKNKKLKTKNQTRQKYESWI